MKAAVITGGTGGLGSALALELGSRGFHVLSLYHRDVAAAEDLTRRMNSAGVLGLVLQQDITDAGVAKALDGVEFLGAATEIVLVNNAAARFEPKPFHLHEWKEIAAALETAAKGSFLCTKALLRRLVAKHGTVVNVLSRAVTGDVPKGFGGYVIAKSALLGMTRALAAEYAGRLRVFSVSPGFLETRLTAGWDERLRERMKDDPSRTPETVALAIADRVCSNGTVGRGEDYPL